MGVRALIAALLALPLQESAIDQARRSIADLGADPVEAREEAVERLSRLAADPAVSRWLEAERDRARDSETRGRLQKSLCRASHRALRGLFVRKLAEIGRHSGDLQRLAYTPDGKYLVTAGGYRGEIAVWDTATWKPAIRFDTSGSITSLSAGLGAVGFTQSMRRGLPGRAVVVGLASRRTLVDLETAGESKIALRPDGEEAALSDDSGVRIFSLPGGELRIALAGLDACYSADSKRVAVHQPGRLSFRNSASLEEERGCDLEGVCPRLLLPRPGTPDIIVIDEDWVPYSAAGPAVRRMSPARPEAQTAAIDASGRRAVQIEGGMAVVVDLETGAPLLSWLAHPHSLEHAAFDPRGGFVATCGYGPFVTVWRLPDRLEPMARVLPIEEPLHVSTAGDMLFWKEGSLWSLSAQPGAEAREVAPIGKPDRLSATPDGEAALLEYEDGVPIALSIGRGEPMADLSSYRERYLGGTLAGDGARLLIATEDSCFEIWCLKEGVPLTSRKIDVQSALVSPTLRHVVEIPDDSVVPRVVDLLSGTHRRLVIDCDRLTDANLAFSPDGRLLAVGSGDIHLFDLETGRRRTLSRRDRPFPAGPDCDYRLAFDASGRRLLGLGSAAWADFQIVEVWDAAEGRRIGASFHAGRFVSATFLADGRIALRGAEEVRIVELRPEPEVAAKLEAGASYIHDLSADRAGRRALTRGADGTAKLWDLEGGRLLRAYGSERFPVAGAWILPGTDHLVLSGRLDPTEVRRLDDDARIALLDERGGHHAFCVSSGLGLLAAAGTGHVRVWDLASWLPGVRHDRLDPDIDAICFEGSALWVAQSGGG